MRQRMQDGSAERLISPFLSESLKVFILHPHFLHRKNADGLKYEFALSLSS